MEEEKQVDERIRVVHPAQIEHESEVVVVQALRCFRLYDGGQQKAECCEENVGRLILDELSLVIADFPVVQQSDKGRDEAEEILGVGRSANPYARDVGVRAVGARHGVRRKETRHRLCSCSLRKFRTTCCQ